MRSPTYYRVRTLARIAFWLAVLAVFYLIATHIWWVDGYCFGTVEECGL
jgi:hypothetical protein